jgi:hypothetical protein
MFDTNAVIAAYCAVFFTLLCCDGPSRKKRSPDREIDTDVNILVFMTAEDSPGACM